MAIREEFDEPKSWSFMDRYGLEIGFGALWLLIIAGALLPH
jgi:hypothetical protein